MKTLLVVTFALFSAGVFGQSTKIAGNEGDTVLTDPSPWQFSMSAGASVGSVFGQAYSASFLAPRLSYAINDRLSAFGGIRYSKFMMPVMAGIPDAGGIGLGQFTGVGAFAGMSYQLNPRLLVYGAVDATHYTLPRHNFEQSSFTQPGYTVGFEYKTSENFSFGVEISKGNAYQSPFGSQSFRPGRFSPVSPVF